MNIDAIFQAVVQLTEESCYIALGASQMHVAEQKQLGERLFKLRDFLGSKKFNELGDCERARLNRQVTLMSEYFEVLTERLDYAFQ